MFKVQKHVESSGTVKLPKTKIDKEIYQGFSSMMVAFGLSPSIMSTFVECMMLNFARAYDLRFNAENHDLDDFNIDNFVTIFNEMFPYAKNID